LLNSAISLLTTGGDRAQIHAICETLTRVSVAPSFTTCPMVGHQTIGVRSGVPHGDPLAWRKAEVTQLTIHPRHGP
jgi:hypothetical protein